MFGDLMIRTPLWAGSIPLLSKACFNALTKIKNLFHIMIREAACSSNVTLQYIATESHV